MVQTPGKPYVQDGARYWQSLHQPALLGVVPTVRGMLAEFLRRLNVSANRSVDIQMAVTEACANVVRHAYPAGDGDLLYECEATDDEIVVRVRDWGSRSHEPSARPGLGLGIPLMARLSDHFTQSRIPGGTLVEMRFARLGGP